MKKIIFAACLATVTAAGVYSATDGEDSSPDIMKNRVWIDHLPQAEDDIAEYKLFFESGGYNLAVELAASEFREVKEIGNWHSECQGTSCVDGHTVVFHQLQDNVERAMPYVAYECQESGFSYCMDIQDGSKMKHFFSMKGWEVEDVSDIKFSTELLEQ